MEKYKKIIKECDEFAKCDSLDILTMPLVKGKNDEIYTTETIKLSDLMEQNVRPTNNAPVGVDAIKKSKLPDEIKRLMLENPIQSPQQSSAVLSDELIEKASKLMGNMPKKETPPAAAAKSVIQSPNVDMRQLSKLVKEAVNSALEENGLLVESAEKSNDLFSFRVGSHIFEGKITKVKKIK